MALPTPVAYWPFDEASGTTAADASGNGHTATLNHGTWDTSTARAFGAAALKNTVGGYGASFATINLGTVHSVAFWMNGWDDTTSAIIIGDATTNFYGCFVTSLQRMFYAAGVGNFQSITHTTSLVGMHHIVVVRNGTSLTFYRDSLSVGTATLTTNTPLTLSTISGAGDNTNIFAATLDDMRLYDVALSAAQVAELYHLNPDLPGTALTVIQSTPKVNASTLTVACVFAVPPAIGHGVIVCTNIWRADLGWLPDTCADNYGNTYVRVTSQTQSFAATALFYCAAIVTTGAGFTVTVTPAGGVSGAPVWSAIAIEASAGLLLDQLTGDRGTSGTPATGSTAALTGTTVLQAACHAITATQTVMSVGSATPPWTQWFEELSSTFIAGEADTRTVVNAAGTTPSCSWTDSNGNWAAILVVFKSSATPPVPPGQTKARLGNKHGKTNEHGAVVVVPGPAGSGIGTPTKFPNLPGPATDTGALQVATVTAGALRSPFATLDNLRVTSDDQGSLRVAQVTAGVLGPLTLLRNVRCRTDETGALLVTTGPAGSLTSPASPLLNLMARSDDQGALVVSGLGALAASAVLLEDGAFFLTETGFHLLTE